MEDYMMRQWIKEIQHCSSAEELLKIRERFHSWYEQDKNIFALNIRSILWLNDFHDELIRASVRLALQQMAIEPPVPFYFVQFGSGGRGEQTLWSDQDNCLIYEQGDEGDFEKLERYFTSLGDVIVRQLQQVGYPPCEGKVICSDPMWCLDASRWKGRMNAWMREPSWEHVRYILICCDVRVIYTHLAPSFEACVPLADYEAFHEGLLPYFVDNTLKHKVLINVFGGFIKEKYGVNAGSIDLKYGAYIPMVNAIRLLAIAHGIKETSTLQRMKRLQQLQAYPDALIEEWKDAFEYFLRLRMRTPYELENGMYSTNGMLKLQTLSKVEIQQLKSSLRTGSVLQKMIQRRLGRLS